MWQWPRFKYLIHLTWSCCSCLVHMNKSNLFNLFIFVTHSPKEIPAMKQIQRDSLQTDLMCDLRPFVWMCSGYRTEVCGLGCDSRQRRQQRWQSLLFLHRARGGRRGTQQGGLHPSGASVCGESAAAVETPQGYDAGPRDSQNTHNLVVPSSLRTTWEDRGCWWIGGAPSWKHVSSALWLEQTASTRTLMISVSLRGWLLYFCNFKSCFLKRESCNNMRLNSACCVFRGRVCSQEQGREEPWNLWPLQHNKVILQIPSVFFISQPQLGHPSNPE